MREKIIASLAGIVCISLSGVAQAQDDLDRGLYVGFGLELLRADIRGSDNGTPFRLTARPLTLVGRVGYHLFPWLSVEGFGSFGIHDDPNDGTIGTNETVRNGETNLNYHFGGAVKPQYTITFGEATNFTFYALGGYSAFDIDGDASNANNGSLQVDFDREDDDYYYGAGVQLDGEIASFVIQYVEYARGDGLDLEGYQLSINRYF